MFEQFLSLPLTLPMAGGGGVMGQLKELTDDAKDLVNTVAAFGVGVLILVVGLISRLSIAKVAVSALGGALVAWLVISNGALDLGKGVGEDMKNAKTSGDIVQAYNLSGFDS